MSDSYTTHNVEGYFQTSHDQNGDYVKAGHGRHLVRWDPEQNARILYVPLDDGEPTEEVSWESKGLSCFISSEEVIAGKGRMCVVRCNEAEYFREMAQITAVLLQEPIIGASKTIQFFKEQRRFLSSPPMTTEKATGLFGELFFLARWLDDSWSKRIAAWDGPERSMSDFNFQSDNLSIEVKTTGSDREPTQHIISSITQLNVQSGQQLLLFSLVARPDPAGTVSLDDLVTEVLTSLQTEPEALTEFTEKLKRFQCYPDQQDLHRFKFHLAHGPGDLYRVDDTFPRLVPDDFGTDSDGPSDERVSVKTYSVTMIGLDNHKLSVRPRVTSDSLVELLVDT